MFPVDDVEWRKWMNQDCYKRQGIGFLEMTDAQREAALGLMHASLSAEGLKLARDIMHLDTTLGQLSNNNFARYGEGRYWITVMGEPSPDQPWGWQIDGHHLVINYFVLGDQVVMSPVFLGSEPGIAKSGKYAGTAILQREQAGGLAFLRGLDDAQRAKAVLSVSKISTTTSASVQGQRGPRLRRRARGCAHRHATRAVARAGRPGARAVGDVQVHDADASSEPGCARDQQQPCPNDDGPDGSRDARTDQCETFDGDGCRHDSHRAQVHDPDDQEDRHQTGTALAAVEAEAQAVSPGRAGVGRQRTAAPG